MRSMYPARNTSCVLRAWSKRALSYLFSRADLGTYRRVQISRQRDPNGIYHKATNTRLRVMSSKAKSAFGIVPLPAAGSRRTRARGKPKTEH